VRSDTYDALDRKLVHALQLDARAPFSRIADVLGVSDQTAARRYARLRSTGAVRVLGLTDPYVDGDVPWFVRVRCAPAVVTQVAEALARRDDTAWVRVTSGGTEVVCGLRGQAGTESLLLDRLPGTPKVEAASAHCVLHLFYGGSLSMITKHGGLIDAQVRALRPADPPDPAGATGRRVREDDGPLLAALSQDGRMSVAGLVAATGWAPSTVRRRLAELRAAGTLYFDLDFDRRLFPSLAVWAMLWLAVEPAALDTAGHALAAHPEVALAAATTGTTNLCASVAAPSIPALYTYLTGPIAALPGLRTIETAPVIRDFKTAGPTITAPRPAPRAPGPPATGRCRPR
jgi:DNA-binding Lrp family transcriptional regulator